MSSATPLSMVFYDDPLLRRKGVRWGFGVDQAADKNLAKLADQMLEKMHAEKGIGLAAQQIGKNIMMTVIDISRPEEEGDFGFLLDGKELPLSLIMPLVLVNPTLKLQKGETEWFEEGCLSFPGIRAEIERPTTLTCNYQDLQGAPHTLVCNGLLARVIQHEVDHLNGILFIDRMPKSTVKKLWPQLEAMKISRGQP